MQPERFNYNSTFPIPIYKFGEKEYHVLIEQQNNHKNNRIYKIFYAIDVEDANNFSYTKILLNELIKDVPIALQKVLKRLKYNVVRKQNRRKKHVTKL